MTLTFFGTGADTAYPLPFCNCENCLKAIKLGGKNLRKRSSVIINSDLIIDLGPDVMSASFMHQVSISSIRYWLQTHPHSDHFDPAHLSTRIPEYAVKNVEPLNLFASNATIDKMSEMLRSIGYINDLKDQNEQRRLNLNVNPITHNETFKVGTYVIEAIATNHDQLSESFVYAVSENDKTILYGTDIDDLPEVIWQPILDKKLQFDLVVLDHTYGPNIDGIGHINAAAFERHIIFMRERGMLKIDALVYATHISHEGNPVHEELERYAKMHGYKIAYDGLVVEV